MDSDFVPLTVWASPALIKLFGEKFPAAASEQDFVLMDLMGSFSIWMIVRRLHPGEVPGDR